MPPPTNTPSETPSISPHRLDRSPAPPSVDTALPQLLPPHLISPTWDEANQQRVRVLHGPVQVRSHRHAQPGSEARLRRPSAALRREQDRQPRDQAYGQRIPLVRPGQRQSLYDWAPAVPLDHELERRLLPPPSGRVGDNDSELEAQLSRPELSGSEPRVSRYAEALGPNRESTFRAAFMQSLLHSPRRPQRSRPQTQGRSLERAGEQGTRDDINRPRLEWIEPDVWSGSRPSRLRAEQGRDSNFSPVSVELQEAIDYLSKVRACSTPEESFRLAVKAGFNRGVDWLALLDEQSKCDDLILDTKFLHAAETSWLRVGGVFWGTQATPEEARRITLPPLTSSSSLSSTMNAALSQVDPSRRESGRNMTSSSCNVSSNQWTVKVSISSIDYSQMRLTGTMEAFTEWATSPSSITTYLEGEIVDFNIHSFKTSNLTSSLKEDATNWRKLEPFFQMTNEELVKNLVSRKFMSALTDEYLFMRWKEKCFISPQTDPDMGGLTISGFYFLSLRRSDGRIQGYYHDPKSLINQELRLKPQKRLFPTYEFR